MAFDMAKKWLFNVFLKKAIKRGVQIAVAGLIGMNIKDFGVTLDETMVMAGVWTGLEAGRQWIKVKTEWSWL